jgi:hypothetical protein
MSESEPDLHGYYCELNKEGRLGEAAKWAYLDVVATLLDEGFEANRYVRIAYASLIRGLSSDVQAGNLQRARETWQTLYPCFEGLFVGGDHQQVTWVGFCIEWRGDARLILGLDGAKADYQTAHQLHTALIDTHFTFWNGEESNMRAKEAIYDFLDPLGIDISKDNVYKRTEEKIEIYEQLYGSPDR